MKNLIIHPNDPTTSFLAQIYAPLRNKTVITGGITKTELHELIEKHDRIIMLGHGTPYGLGKMIPDPQQLEGWGKGVIRRLANALKNELSEVKGFTERNLKFIV